MAGQKIFFRNKAILLKKEDTYGTDIVPTASEVIRASNFLVTPIEAEEINRENVAPYMGSGDMFLTGKHVALSFDVELSGSGTAGTAPAYADALLGCGLAETVNAGTDVEYDPVSDSFDSVSIYCYIDKVLHKMTGARGNVTFSMSGNELPKMTFSFLGIFVEVSASTVPSVSFTSFENPVVHNSTNTPTLSLHSATIKATSVELDLGQQVNFRQLLNDESVEIGDRNATGTIRFDMQEVGDKDWFAAITAHTKATLQVVHGTTSGNIIQLDAPAVQIGKPSYEEDNGITLLSAPLILHPSSGNDELKLTVK